MRSTSSICSPQVTTGLSAVIGSWKIIDMRVPRSSRSRSVAGRQDVLALQQDLAELACSALASRPVTACER